MIEILVQKTPNNMLMPTLPEGIEAIKKLKTGKDIMVKMSTSRKGWYHRKVFALLNFAFENTERVCVEHKGEVIEQSFEMFRKDAIVLAGFYTVEVSMSGMLRKTPDSISYENCTQEKIEQIYTGLLNVVSRRLFEGGYTPQELDKLTEEWLRFATT